MYNKENVTDINITVKSNGGVVQNCRKKPLLSTKRYTKNCLIQYISSYIC